MDEKKLNKLCDKYIEEKKKTPRVIESKTIIKLFEEFFIPGMREELDRRLRGIRERFIKIEDRIKKLEEYEMQTKNYEGEGLAETYESSEMPGTHQGEGMDKKENLLLEIEEDVTWTLSAEIEIFQRLCKINDFLFSPPREDQLSKATEKNPDPPGKLNQISDNLKFIKAKFQKINNEIDFLYQILP